MTPAGSVAAARAGAEARRPGDPRAAGISRRAVRFAGGLLSLVLFLSLSACGYRLQTRPESRFADPQIRVDLRPFLNQSLVPDAGAYLAARLREEMRRTGFRGTFAERLADYAIDGTVRDVHDEVVSHGKDQFALEHRLRISVDVRIVEVAHGRLLWKGEGLSDGASYFAGPDFQYTESNRRKAFEEVCRRMARRIGQTLRVIL